jgi:serpin B
LPYDGRELSMVILLPGQRQFNSFESSLTSRQVGDIIGKIGFKEVSLSMPKFTFESTFGLKQALASLGMNKTFSPGIADLSGMDGRQDLFIQDVLHKAFVAVDENGTEAAAASAVIVGTTSMPTEIIKLNIDRPFIFLIRDVKTGTILFVGRVLNPAL